MSVLAKIRSKAGLLVAIIAIALFSFVLGDLLTSGNGFLQSQDNNVAKIKGEAISYNEFNAKVEQAIEKHKKNTGESSIDDQIKDMLLKQTWDQLLNDKIMDREYKELGIAVSDDELYDIMLGANPHPYLTQFFTDRQSGKIFEQYAMPDGSLNVAKVAEFTQQMNPEQEGAWVSLENAVKKARINTKYNNLIKKGVYVTSTQAKREYIDENKTCKVQYVMKRFSYVADSTIAVDDSDIKK